MKSRRTFRIWYFLAALTVVVLIKPGTATADTQSTGPLSREQWVATFPDAAPASDAERRLLDDAADGKLDNTSLLRAALISSGLADSATIKKHESKIDSDFRLLAATLPKSTSNRQRARQILECLHENVLVGQYDADATNLDTALHSGRFNCVSSTILFCYFAERLQLDVRIVELPGHVRCLVRDPHGWFVVEPTCADWFEVLHDPLRRKHLLGQTIGYRPRSSAGQRTITTVQLIAMIYYNRGIQHLKCGEYRAAVSANLRSFLLDQDSVIVRGNMLAAVNNWSLHLTKYQGFKQASDLLELGLQFAPDYQHFLLNDIHVHQCWMAQLWQAERYEEAARRLEAARRRRPDAAYFDKAIIECYRHHANHFLADGDLAAALEVCENARQRFGQKQEWLDAEGRLLSQHAERLVESSEIQEAVQCLDAALARLPANPMLVANRQATVIQWASLAIEKRDFAEAIRRYRLATDSDYATPPFSEHLRYGYHSWIEDLVREGQARQAREVLLEARTVMPKDNIWQQWQAVLDREFD